jgi:hypothetical protein
MAGSAAERDERLRELSSQLGPLEELGLRADALGASAAAA